MSGCVFCSPYFTPLVEKHRAVSRPPGSRAPRGRGGRGRSRGRPRPPKDKMAQLAAYFVWRKTWWDLVVFLPVRLEWVCMTPNSCSGMWLVCQNIYCIHILPFSCYKRHFVNMQMWQIIKIFGVPTFSCMQGDLHAHNTHFNPSTSVNTSMWCFESDLFYQEYINEWESMFTLFL